MLQKVVIKRLLIVPVINKLVFYRFHKSIRTAQDLKDLIGLNLRERKDERQIKEIDRQYKQKDKQVARKRLINNGQIYRQIEREREGVRKIDRKFDTTIFHQDKSKTISKHLKPTNITLEFLSTRGEFPAVIIQTNILRHQN